MTATDPVSPDLAEQLNIDIIIRDPKWEEAVSGVDGVCRHAAQAAFAAARAELSAAEAAIVLADDEFVAGLNQQYREREGATNVLSFAAADSDMPPQALPGMPAMLGDVIVAREITEREAVSAGISIEHHLRHLIVHGMLHLLGFDHMTDEEAAEMESLETAILGEMGIRDPYGQEVVGPAEPKS